VYIFRMELNSAKEIEVKKKDVDGIIKEGKEIMIGEAKLAKQKEEYKKKFSKVYFDIALLFNSPTLLPVHSLEPAYIGGIQYTAPYTRENLYGLGGGLRIGITNSYSSFVLFGASINFSYLYAAYTGYIESRGILNFTTNIQALLGLNWNISNKVFIQPYIQVGPFLDYCLVMPYDKGTGNYIFTVENIKSLPQREIRVLVTGSLGLKVPIRVGKDLFISPFIEMSVVSAYNFRLQVNAGIGFSF
jgi:hypothetical protein